MHYNFRNRIQNINWSLITIENLLEQSQKSKNASLVIYAALESRQLIERVEFETIIMCANSRFTNADFESIKNHHGIQNANKKFNALKLKYQTFSESFQKAVKPELSFKIYDYRKAEGIKENLSQYIHIYSRTDQELEFDSNFVQEGCSVIQSATDFIKEYVTSTDDGGHYFGILDFTTIPEPLRAEFLKWLKSPEQNNSKLTERLLELVKEK